MSTDELPAMDHDAFDAWARLWFKLGDDVLEVKPGSDGDTACVWAIREHSDGSGRRDFDRYVVPGVRSAIQLMKMFPVRGTEQDVPSLFDLI